MIGDPIKGPTALEGAGGFLRKRNVLGERAGRQPCSVILKQNRGMGPQVAYLESRAQRCPARVPTPGKWERE
jgi:hypothetical protein